MQFWCSALKEPWSWAWRPYVGVWILCLGLLTAYAVAVRRRRHTNPAEPDAGKRALWFALGVLAIWVASDWPVGLLGSSYLSSVHMAQYMLYTLAAAPLLILGVPEWMARRLLGKLRLYRTVRFLARPSWRPCCSTSSSSPPTCRWWWTHCGQARWVRSAST